LAKRTEIYKCDACGNIVEVVDGGDGELVCCGESMKLMNENTVDAAKEKHVPVIEKVEGGIKVSVGEVFHPMEEKHFIQWIEVDRRRSDLSSVSRAGGSAPGCFQSHG
jgi:superoxide reductase